MLVTSFSTIRLYDVVSAENVGVSAYPSIDNDFNQLFALWLPSGIIHLDDGILSYTGMLNLNVVLLSVYELYAFLALVASDLGASTLVIYWCEKFLTSNFS